MLGTTTAINRYPLILNSNLRRGISKLSKITKMP
jgi:hypothetical protein